MKTWTLLTLTLLCKTPWAAAQSLSLETALQLALQANPEITGATARAEAERSTVRAQYSLDNPRLGLMHENNMNFMETMMGPMNTWSITQEIKFPTKYFLMAAAQSAKAESFEQDLAAKRLEVRAKVINAYYNVFSSQQILSLLTAQRETLMEVARSAEARHSTGAVPQQDEMKAHVEQTKIEADILNIQEEQETAQAALNALLNQTIEKKNELTEKDLPVPQIKGNLETLPEQAQSQSKQLKSVTALSDEAIQKRTLAAWNFTPDFTVTYKKAWTSAPSDNYAFGVEISVPLWFFAKQSGEYRSASARSTAAERAVEETQLSIGAKIRSLLAKVKAHNRLLKIYDTSLIPQATSTLSSSRTAYQAGRVNFLEFLDSERSLYEVRIAYYRTLTQFIDYLTQLEEVSSTSISSLPFGDRL